MEFDSDDEFSDGIVLDDQMLAALDEEESRFQRATLDPGPPPKRRKLDTGHPQNLEVFGNSTLDDSEELPDITIRRDGTYGIELQGPITLTPNAAPDRNTRTRVSKPTVIPSNNSLGSTSAGRNPTTHAPQRPSQSRRPPSTTHPTRVPSARVEARDIPRSQSDSRPHIEDPARAALFDVELADMRRLTLEV
ncbi:hypothetical protein M405DRAFT_58358 [Rhizopogon salebrosus TDB-379]|nr:hypothetical protein M405DRAFT_58358 [Rhizopogon salebrosus TDB-379]